MSKIVLYAGENFTDSYETFQSDTSDYKPLTSLPGVKSLKVSSGAWIVYSGANYNGNIAVYKAGKYGSNLKINTVGSFRKLSGSLDNPKITVFEKIKYQGSEKELKGTEYPSVPTPFKSHKVVKGVWILYEKGGFTGNSIVSIKDDQVPNEEDKGLDDSVKSLKAYMTYEQ